MEHLRDCKPPRTAEPLQTWDTASSATSIQDSTPAAPARPPALMAPECQSPACQELSCHLSQTRRPHASATCRALHSPLPGSHMPPPALAASSQLLCPGALGDLAFRALLAPASLQLPGCSAQPIRIRCAHLLCTRPQGMAPVNSDDGESCWGPPGEAWKQPSSQTSGPGPVELQQEPPGHWLSDGAA